MYTLKQDLKAGTEVSEELAKLMPELVEESDELKPDHGDTYWIINYFDKVVESRIWDELRSILVDQNSFDLGNFFLTEAEALEELDYRLAEAELKRIAKRLNGDRESDGYYNYIWWNRETGCAAAGVNYGEDIMNVIEFIGEDLAEQAITEMGDTKLRAYFRVK